MDAFIRLMQGQDMVRVLQIYEQAIQERQSTFDTECPDEHQWDQLHLPVGRLAVELENKVVGWAALSPVSTKKALWGLAEVSLYIDAAARGKGLGRALLAQLIEVAQGNGFWCLQAAIFPENQASISLHEKMGFRLVGVREKMGLHFGVWRDVWLFEKRLL